MRLQGSTGTHLVTVKNKRRLIGEDDVIALDDFPR